MSNKSLIFSNEKMINRVRFSNCVFREKRSTLLNSKVTVVLGTQWGDEGKGKIIDMLTSEYDICCRCQGGNNTSHSVVADGTEFHFHLLPSGVIHEKCVSVIGNGVVIYLPGLFSEIEDMKDKGITKWKNRLIISDRCHLVFDFHQKFDEQLEHRRGINAISTTIRKGIGPAYTSKASRNGIRICDLLGDFEIFEEKFKAISAIYRKLFSEIEINEKDELDRYRNYIPKLRPYVKDTIYYLHRALQQGKKIIIEGASAAMLDIDFGTYPYVSSNNCSIGGVLTGLGLPAQCIGDVIGVVKSYTTRVGNGPFPTEQLNAIGDIMEQRSSNLFSTKKRRRCGWLDLVLLKYTSYINGYTAIALTKLDIFDTFKEIKIGIAYILNGKILDYFPSTAIDLENIEVQYITLPGWETSITRKRQFNDLPKNAQEYIKYIENEIGVPVKWIGVGPGREAIVNIHPIIHL